MLVWPPVLVFANDVESLKHGVVKITAKNPNRVGTGVIVGIKENTAYIATASHVIEGDPSPQVTFYQDVTRTFAASIQGMEGGDPKGLAALMVKGDLPENIRPIAFNSDIKFSGGEKVTVIGFPRMVPVPWAVTEGTITGETGLDLIFTGAVEEGNSGGPVLYQGRVVGLMTDITGSYNYAKPAVIAKYALQNWQLIFNDSVPGKFTEPELPTVEIEPTLPPSKSSLPIAKIGNDGMPMVLVPAGEFMMGSQEGVGETDEHPQHLVELDRFYLDKHEVSNQQFQKFVETTEYRTTAEQKGSAYGYTVDDEWKDIPGANWRQPEEETSVFASGRGMHPVVAVSWEDATAYCSWAGKRLPSEAEWEYAARGGMTSEYWWGTGAPDSRKVGNFADETVKQRFSSFIIMEGYEDGYIRTAPVGVFEANPWGLHDMTGNAWEWVADWYDAEYYGKGSRRNPQGPDKGEYRVFRGGSWSDKPQDFRSANREKGTATIRRATNGFRCAQDAP